MKRTAGIFLIMIAATCSFCRNKVTNQPVVTEQQKSDSLQLIGYTVHFVNLPFEYIVKDEQGEKKQYTKAWLVKLEFKKMSDYPAQRVDFAIGDYIIPEYGGWERGIYFRIYEEALLNKLNHQEIRYRLPGSDKLISTGRLFEMPMDKKLEPEDENKVLNRKN